MIELRLKHYLQGIKRWRSRILTLVEIPRPRKQRGATRRRHFRASVLWTFAVISIAQVVLGTVVDIGSPAVLDPEYAGHEAILLDRLAENRGIPVVMMLGSSRVYHGLDARTASNAVGGRALVFNFGIPASGPFLDKIWLKRLQRRGIKPDVLFIEIISTHFASDRAPPDQRFLDAARLSVDELAELPVTQCNLVGPARHWIMGRVLPTWRHQAALRTLFGIDDNAPGVRSHRDLPGVDHYGWAACADDNPALNRNAHDQYDRFFRDFRLSQMQVDLLEQNIAACQRQGIETVLLLTPEGSEFRNQYTPAMSAAIDEMLAQVRDRFHVQVVDARDWVEDAGFFDMHHLRMNGAQAFSERLAREVIEPLLNERGRSSHAALSCSGQ